VNELLNNLALGFGVALTWQNLAYAFFGAMLGTLIGVLPGLGPVATIAMLLPSIYALDATPALIMLAGIYYGAQYGGSTTAILINVPGESSSVVTAIDGYKMARKGRAGAALAAAGLGSFFAGCVGTIIIAADGDGLQVRPGRILRADGGGPDRRGRAGLGLARQGHRHDLAGPAARADQHRRDLRRAALQLRHTGADRWLGLCLHRHGRVRFWRDHRQPLSPGRAPRGLHQGREGPVANLGGCSAGLPRRVARYQPGIAVGRAAWRRRTAGRVRRLHGGKEGGHEAGRGSVWPGQHPGRGGARECQQRRRADQPTR
jgi:Tripartite tricarboxylate transporter TctA family